MFRAASRQSRGDKRRGGENTARVHGKPAKTESGRLSVRETREEDRDYADSFAVPSDATGITYVMGRQSCDTRKLEKGHLDRGNIRFGGHEALILFEDAFIPWDRVFMFREHDFTGILVELFASYHRQSYACKGGGGDVLIGAVQTIAEYKGGGQGIACDRRNHRKEPPERNALLWLHCLCG
jgi:aromatic ring hydroxylase